MQVRLLLASNLILLFVVITVIIFIFLEIEIGFAIISMSLTYAMLLTQQFCDLMIFYSGVEQRMVSVERMRQYYENDQEDLKIIPKK